MELFQSLIKKFENSINAGDKLLLTGISPVQYSFIFSTFLLQPLFKIHPKLNRFVLVCDNVEAAENVYTSLLSSREIEQKYCIKTFRGLDISPYQSVVSSERNLFARFETLDFLSRSEKPTILICDYSSLFLKSPPKKFFKENHLQLTIADIISPQELASKLVALGYRPSSTTEEPGTFCSKGEIFDIFSNSSSSPSRILYFDDMIEEIFSIDVATQKTLHDQKLEHLDISVCPHILTQVKYSTTFRSSIPIPGPSFRKKYEHRKGILDRLSNNQLFEDYPKHTPYFFESCESLFDYLADESTLIMQLNSNQIESNMLEFYETLRSQYTSKQNDIESSNILADPDTLFDANPMGKLQAKSSININQLSVEIDLDSAVNDSKPLRFNNISLRIEEFNSYIKRHINPAQSKFDFIKSTLRFLRENFCDNSNLAFTYKNDASKNELLHLLKQNEYSDNQLTKISFYNHSLDRGFFYKDLNFIVISDSDFFSYKKAKITRKAQRNIDLFADQLATLKSGDYVIHKEYGVGTYLGLENITTQGVSSDFLVIAYADQDKIYVPVYRMNLIQKHADSTSSQKVASLKSSKFETQKNRAKKSAKKLAFDLLKLQAQRQATNSFAFSPPDHHDKEFELAFPFEETRDQELAIEDVLADMQKKQPMDRLVCGDVGFGKTEIAMRAAFKAVLDNKQVAILVPTTILALQHFHSFKKRFSNFPVNIDHMSRLRTTTQTRETKQNLKDGKVDIVIGTHKLLAGDIEFADLGLVIIDEEQRFGVGHKEKMKLLKASVDFLTLTATPIPRTLQLAFLGLKDLSIIQTAPPKRQSIKTYLVKDDNRTIQEAIEKEISRGGQVFIVHNRVKDIEIYAAKISRLVPKAKIVIGHGQLPERELEKRINAFYDKKFDILLSTTIIESGLDIPSANTMIINRANNFGLSQLHQLRGRIGRAERKAYAYFIIPNENLLTEVAKKRLHALQTYADLGSGFSLASSDLEIRGAGDILGAEQSGHIESVGLELYMELLKDAIDEIKGDNKITNCRNIEIQTPERSLIPEDYIADSSNRLKYYKKLANSSSLPALAALQEEMSDIYGPPPSPLKNLFSILTARIDLQELGITSLKAMDNRYILNFNRELVEKDENLRDKILRFFMSRPKIYKINPNFSIICITNRKYSNDYLLEFSKNIAQQIDIC